MDKISEELRIETKKTGFSPTLHVSVKDCRKKPGFCLTMRSGLSHSCVKTQQIGVVLPAGFQNAGNSIEATELFAKIQDACIEFHLEVKNIYFSFSLPSRSLRLRGSLK